MIICQKLLKQIQDENDQLRYVFEGDIVMLVTYSWRQFSNVGERILILVASLECWCPAQI